MKIFLYGTLVLLLTPAAWAKPQMAKKLEFEIDLATSTVRIYVEKLGKKESFEVTVSGNREMLDPTHHFIMQRAEHVITLSRGVHYLQYIYRNGPKEILENDLFVLHLEEAKMPDHDPPQPEESFWEKRANRIALGVGMSVVDYQQQIPTRAALTYQDFRFPAMYLEAQHEWSPAWAGALSMRMGAGGFDNSAVTVDKQDYHWSTIAAEGVWTSSLSLNWGVPLNWGAKVSALQHRLPLLHINSLGNPNFKAVEFLAAAVGGWLRLSRRRWAFEVGLGYQHPLSIKAPAGDKLEIASPMFVDLSLGTRYRLSERWEAGAFVFSRYHKYGFTYHDGTIQSTGDLSVMYTTFDARIGWFF